LAVTDEAFVNVIELVLSSQQDHGATDSRLVPHDGTEPNKRVQATALFPLSAAPDAHR